MFSIKFYDTFVSRVDDMKNNEVKCFTFISIEIPM